MKHLGALLLCSGIAVVWLFFEPLKVPQDITLQTIPWQDMPLRLTVLGTSLTADYDWPERLERCTRSKLVVTKLAKGGAGSDWGRTQFDKLDATDPDIVLVEFAINDADLRLGISRQQSRQNHHTILHHLRRAHPDAQIVLMTMNSAHGIRRYLLRPQLPAYYGLYRELADEFGTGLLDFYPRWRALDAVAREQADGLHPSQEAAAQVILPALSAYLGIGLDPDCANFNHT